MLLGVWVEVRGRGVLMDDGATELSRRYLVLFLRLHTAKYFLFPPNKNLSIPFEMAGSDYTTTDHIIIHLPTTFHVFHWICNVVESTK